MITLHLIHAFITWHMAYKWMNEMDDDGKMG